MVTHTLHHLFCKSGPLPSQYKSGIFDILRPNIFNVRNLKKGTTWRLYVRLYRRINTSNTYFSVKSPVITLTTSVFLFSLNCCCFDVVLILDSVCAVDREYKFSLPDYRYLNLHCDAEWPKLPPLALPVKLTIHPSRFLVALSSSAR